MGRYQAHYEALFRALEAEHGALDDETHGSIIGFSGGGPVSLSSVDGQRVYVTCELSVYPGQLPSAEGLQYELLVRGWLDASMAQTLLTELGDLSMQAALGHGHTIDLSGRMPAGTPAVVQLREYCRASIDGQDYGVYEVLDASESK